MPPYQENPVSIEALREIAADHGLSIKPEDEPGYLALTQAIKESVDFVYQLPDYIDPELTPDLGLEEVGARTYTRPSPSENPLNAWMHKTRITAKQPTSTLLAGKTVAIKDNASVAGVPLTVGTQPFHLVSGSKNDKNPYPIPSLDAVVVTRVLAAGATVTGTSTCENYCASGRSVTSATGPVHNPWLRGYDAGGSSSGSAALVAISVVRRWREARGLDVRGLDLGEGADFALGADQGGSIRIPASACGVYGLKPTHGLVPYTGLSSTHPLVDHAGPLAGTIRDAALLLAVLAGYDGFDDARMGPEAPPRACAPRYHALLDAAVAARQLAGSWTGARAAQGLRVGVLKEGFEIPDLDVDVGAVVRRAAARFATLGADVVREVSVPAHAEMAHRLYAAAGFGNVHETCIYGNAPPGLSFPYPDGSGSGSGSGSGHGNGMPEPKALTQEWFDTMTKSNPLVPSILFSSEYIHHRKRFDSSVRNKAVRHIHELRAAYDRVLDEVDVLIMPVTPTVGVPHPGEMGVAELASFVFSSLRNTEPFNLTGHPAFAIPVGWGKVEGGNGKLPVGMQIVGKRWAEEKLFLAAAAWEVGGWGLDEE